MFLKNFNLYSNIPVPLLHELHHCIVIQIFFAWWFEAVLSQIVKLFVLITEENQLSPIPSSKGEGILAKAQISTGCTQWS